VKNGGAPKITIVVTTQTAGTINASVDVTETTLDPNPSNNSASTTTTVT
jgi:hypothetical protein